MSLAAQALAMGMSPAHVASAKNQAQLRFMIQNYQPAPPPPPAPPPMPQMSQYKPPQLTNATIGATGKGISRPSGKRKPTRLSDLRANRRKLRINEQLMATGTGTGLNIGGLT